MDERPAEIVCPADSARPRWHPLEVREAYEALSRPDAEDLRDRAPAELARSARPADHVLFELLGHLACYFPAILAGHHGRMLDAGGADFASSLDPFHFSGADPDTRDRLIEQVLAAESDRSVQAALTTLAWIGDEGVVARFDAWRAERPDMDRHAGGMGPDGRRRASRPLHAGVPAARTRPVRRVGHRGLPRR